MLRSTVVTAFLLLLPYVAWSQPTYDFELNVTVSDGVNNRLLTIGVDPAASDGFGSEDTPAPPPPPSGAFGAWIDFSSAEDLFVDLRQGNHVEKTFNLAFQPMNGNGPMVLSWDNTGLAAKGRFLLTDVTGSFGPIDMTTTSSIDVSTAGGLLDNSARILVLPNYTPVAVNDAGATDEDNPLTLNVLANDTDGTGALITGGVDADSDDLTVTVVSGPANGGTVVNLDKSITYTPNGDYNGSDSFTYQIDDGNGGVDQATVNLTVNAVNDGPVANDDADTTSEDTPVTISVLANDTDADGDALTVTIVGNPTSGGAVVNPDKTVTYTPNGDFNGADSFTYEVNDGNLGTDQATVNVTVTAVNDAPVANDDADTTNEDTPVTITVLANDTDLDGDALTVTIVGIPTNGGTVVNPDKSVTYTPNGNFNGADSFTYQVDDGNGGTDQATVNITVNSVNDVPVANDDASTTAEDAAVTVNVLANDTDADGDVLTVTIVGAPTSGGAVVNPDKSITYTPNTDFNGIDSFTYEVSDGNGGTDQAAVTITVDGVGDAPVAQDDSDTTVEGITLDVDVLANDTDADGDALTISIVTPPGNGTTLVRAAGTTPSISTAYVSYTPNDGFTGTDVFTYEIADGVDGVDQATVSITVNEVEFAVVVTVSDANTNESSLALGTAFGATADQDSNYDRLAPPAPPPGSFDARFTSTVELVQDFRAASATTVTWPVTFSASTGGTPITFDWDPAKLPRRGSFHLQGGTAIDVDMRLNTAYTLTEVGVSTLNIVYTLSSTRSVSTTSGWNMVGLPLEVTDNAFLSVLPNARSNTLYSYSGGYQSATNLAEGQGYWVRYESAAIENVAGTELGWQEVSLGLGWNLVAGASCPVPLSNISDPGSIIVSGTVWEFNAGSYVLAGDIEGGEAVWMRTSTPGNVTFQCLPAVAGKNGGPQAPEVPEDFYALKATDANGVSRTLYFGAALTEAVDERSFSLPPLPPVGVFDARFDGDRFLVSEELGSRGVEILLQASEYPISLTLTKGGEKAFALEVLSESGAETHTLSPGESVSLDASAKRINLVSQQAVEELPDEFGLEQNYPNPFNPATTITYLLPENSKVTLAVYDVLGRQVAILLQNQEIQAGRHEVTFDAQSLASGVYFYVIQAGSYQATRRMLLLK